jgi:hypothetical protein
MKLFFKKALFATSLIATVSSTASAEDVPITADNWQLTENGAEIVQHEGRSALKLNRGRATLVGSAFHNGIIEFDVWMPEDRGFGGINFRANGKNAENFYLRAHLSGMPDANQYMPIFNNDSSWQIYHGARYSAPTSYNYGNWISVKMVVKDDKMDVYIDSDEPVLHVEDLLTDGDAGELILYGALIDFHFSNISVTRTDDVTLVGKAEPLAELPETRLRSFSVANTPLADTALEGKAIMDPGLLTGLAWEKLDVSENGVANLSEIVDRTRENSTALVHLKLTADKAQTVSLKYGFSDRVTAFLNGSAIAYNDDSYVNRDYRFLGTVGLFDTVFLPLKEGENDVIFAVSEGFGGWAFLADADLPEGVTIE